MRAIIEAGIVLLIVYLFLQYQKNQVAASGLPLPATSTTPTTSPNQAVQGFTEDPGAASNSYETSGGFFLNNNAVTPSPVVRTPSVGSCGCGG